MIDEEMLGKIQWIWPDICQELKKNYHINEISYNVWIKPLLPARVMTGGLYQEMVLETPVAIVPVKAQIGILYLRYPDEDKMVVNYINKKFKPFIERELKMFGFELTVIIENDSEG